MATEDMIQDDEDLLQSIEEVIGTFEDLKTSIESGDYRQSLAEIDEIQSSVNMFRAYIADKAEKA